MTRVRLLASWLALLTVTGTLLAVTSTTRATATSPPATATPTSIPPVLYEPISPPIAPAYMDWRWSSAVENLREVVTDITIHNDIGDWSDEHGYYLILMQNRISEQGFYLGLQTDAETRGKGLIFSRWGTRDLSNARYSDTDGWSISSGNEGDFIGVRRSYNWGAGNYRVRIAPDELESDGEWFGLWITDLSTDETTWIGSLKFPLVDGTASMSPRASATIELYGNVPIRPIDVPQWHVSVKRPLGDGVYSDRGFTRYPFDDSENALPNSDVRYDSSEESAHIVVGGTTERWHPAEQFAFGFPTHCSEEGASESPEQEAGEGSTSESPAAEVPMGGQVKTTASGGTIAYIIGGDNKASFEFDSATAQLNTSVPLDYEVHSSDTVAGTADDPGLMSDCSVLLENQDALEGGVRVLNWSVDIPVESWEGVTVDGMPRRITELALRSEGLRGSIPSELGSLTELTLLVLFDNQLGGQIPTELGSLSNLRALVLSDNKLTGEIPSELGTLSKLQFLNLSNNQLTGAIPTELGNLSELETLSLEYNQLNEEIPTELGGLTNLERLHLLNNQLTGEIPSELGSLSGLTHLYVDGNQLAGKIPSELGDLSNLNTLSLLNNQLSGEIPPELGRLGDLIELHLGSNLLSGEIPPELGSQSNLSSLSLWNNLLSGKIPSELGNLSSLTDMYLGDNQLSGEIPSELGSLSDLESLGLSRNQLGGEIPSELGNLSNLRILSLSSNQLSGEIPSELGSLASLAHMSLWSNQLSGKIPSALGSLSNLQTLWLSSNLLTGCVPQGLQHVKTNDFGELGLPYCVVQGAPVFPAHEAGGRSVEENAAAGMHIGDPVQAEDADDSLTYTLSGVDGASFAIDNATGQLLTFAPLDFETKSIYTVAVTASDGEASAIITVTITVTNVGLDSMYDVDDSGSISRNEVIQAINEYMFGEGDKSTTRDDVIEVISLYLFGG